MQEMFEKVFKLMEKSFPAEEYRSYEGQKKLLENPQYRMITKCDDTNNLMGFMCVWETPKFNFIEHIAVCPNLQGRGIGSRMMKKFISETEKTILLEIEMPCDETTKKRLRFYENLGFKINDFEYYQPVLRKGCVPIQMHLMSYPKILSPEEFNHLKEYIYENIYEEV